MQKQNQLTIELLNSPDKQVGESRDVPARLFREVLRDQNVNIGQWNKYMADYLRDPRNRIPQNSRDMSSARGNLAKELIRPRMTWNVFMKAIRFINPLKVSLRLTFAWRTRKTSVFEFEIYHGTMLQSMIAENEKAKYTIVEPPVYDGSTEVLDEQLDNIDNM